MSCRSATKAATAALVATALAGCSAGSDIYLDRRDSVSLAAGDAMASNRVTHTIDPWSPASANRNIAYSGERMQAAAERYRNHKIIRPISPTTSATNMPATPPPLTTEEVTSQSSSSGQGGSSSTPIK